MGILDYFRRDRPQTAQPVTHVRNEVNGGVAFNGLDDPALLEFIRTGGRQTDQMTNAAVLRCVSLICESVGMLPTNLLINNKTREPAKEHPVYKLLKVAPNTWQTPYEFKSYMQLNLLRHGNAHARIIWRGKTPTMLVPLDSGLVESKLTDAFRMRYTYTTPSGRRLEVPDTEILHLRDLSVDTVTGMSRMKLARGAIALANAAAQAAANVFKTGNLAGGALEFPAPLSEIAFQRLTDSLATEFAGTNGTKRLMLLEEGGKLNVPTTSTDAQHVENRAMQNEEIARVFGVPRPLLMMDETSWGSGIQQLAIFFVQYGLQHWFTVWEQAIQRDLLRYEPAEKYVPKFNEHALLRGTLSEQSEYFSKALGAGGSQPWMTGNEVREALDMPAIDDPEADKLRNPMTQPKQPDPNKDKSNEPAKPA